MNLLKIESWKVQEWMLLLLSVSTARHYYRYCMLRPPRWIRGIKEHETEKIIGLILKFHSYPFCFNKCYKKLTTWTLNRHKSLTQSTSSPHLLFIIFVVCCSVMFMWCLFMRAPRSPTRCSLFQPSAFCCSRCCLSPQQLLRLQEELKGKDLELEQARDEQRYLWGRGPQPQGKGWTDFMAILPNNLHFHMHYSVIWGQKQWLWGAVFGELLWSCCYSI